MLRSRSRIGRPAAILAAVAVWVFAGSASAQVISFDDVPAPGGGAAIPSDLYSGLGVTFTSADDGSVAGGISAGDPGNWGLEGTNGPAFSGFNGNSYAMTIDFDTEVSGFSLDASRSNGSSDGDSITVEGYLGAALVDSVTVNFGAINTWSSISLSGVIDNVSIQGSGAGFHPFGIDNITWSAGGAPAPVPVLPVQALLALIMLLGLVALRRVQPRKSAV